MHELVLAFWIAHFWKEWYSGTTVVCKHLWYCLGRQENINNKLLKLVMRMYWVHYILNSYFKSLKWRSCEEALMKYSIVQENLLAIMEKSSREIWWRLPVFPSSRHVAHQAPNSTINCEHTHYHPKRELYTERPNIQHTVMVSSCPYINMQIILTGPHAFYTTLLGKDWLFETFLCTPIFVLIC